MPKMVLAAKTPTATRTTTISLWAPLLTTKDLRKDHAAAAAAADAEDHKMEEARMTREKQG